VVTAIALERNCVRQPAVKYVFDKLAGKPRKRTRNRGKNDNISKKNTVCIGCGKLCWGNSRTAPKQDHVCMECRRKRNLVRCDCCGREYQRRHRTDQPGLHNYCSAECHYADRQRAARGLHETPKLACEYCGGEFWRKRGDPARFCSRDCYSWSLRKH
jgi:hypothetical protein